MENADVVNLLAEISEDAKAIRQHPAFYAALYWYARRIVDYVQSSPAILRALSGEARYVIFILLLSLRHARRPGESMSGATLANLQVFARHHGLAGPHRVASIIAVMKHGGLVDDMAALSDQRVRLLALTEKGEQVADYLSATLLGAIRLVAPERDFVQLHCNDAEFAGRFYLERLKLYALGVRSGCDEPAFKLFTSQIGGREIMFRIWLALADAEQQDAAPSPRIIDLTFRQLAADLGLSRAHVRTMIETGERQGLLHIRAPGGPAVEIFDHFIEVHCRYTAAEFAVLLHSAIRAAARFGPSEYIDWSFLSKLPASRSKHRRLKGTLLATVDR